MNPADLQLSLAPFQGITTPLFREVFTRHFKGVDKLYTAFFTGGHIRQKNADHPDLAHTHQNGVPVAPQILSKDAEEILLFGRQCRDKGFEEINWNMGCPYPRVANKGRGSGLLPHPDKVEQILESVFPALPVKLSIKCRLGYFSPDEILSLLPVLNRFPLSEIIVHARIGKQLYEGPVNLSAFASALPLSKLPVAYNGDIFSKEDLTKLQQQFPTVNHWMIGRGLLYDPFLAARLKNIPIPENSQFVLYYYVTELYRAYREKTEDRIAALHIMKEFWSYFSNSFANPDQVFNQIKTCVTFSDYEGKISEIFEKSF
ncbi:MAG: tRNA-dihydrouridine synthase family protein [Bacteroidales bacterium]|nr:tRNA-dihydrouridine synthase family protein [Bacteroidales bacterium]